MKKITNGIMIAMMYIAGILAIIMGIAMVISDTTTMRFNFIIGISFITFGIFIIYVNYKESKQLNK